jgi:hypothetical protein
MEKIFGKNWETSLAGLIGAIAVAIYPLLTTGQFNWNNILIAAIIAVVGYFAKSKNVTGVGLEAKTQEDIKNEYL